MNRRTRLLALAWSLPDAIRQPATATSLITRGQRRAASPTVWAVCDTCDGDRVTRDRFHRETPCQACSGLGRYRVDPYTGSQPVASELAPEVRATTRAITCDRCNGQGVRARTEHERATGLASLPRCETCDGTGKVHVPIATDDTQGSNVRRDRIAWTMIGDWPLLDAALVELRRSDPIGCRAFVATFVLEKHRPAEIALSALRFVDDRMPRRITVPAGVVQAYLERDARRVEAEKKRLKRLAGQGWRDDRNERMRRMFRDGHATALIANACDVSEDTVLRVCRNVSTLEAAA